MIDSYDSVSVQGLGVVRGCCVLPATSTTTTTGVLLNSHSSKNSTLLREERSISRYYSQKRTYICKYVWHAALSSDCRLIFSFMLSPWDSFFSSSLPDQQPLILSSLPSYPSIHPSIDTACLALTAHPNRTANHGEPGVNPSGDRQSPIQISSPVLAAQAGRKEDV